MIHSVYSDREVFVRELVSNAADALDKVRFLGLTRTDLVAAGSEHPGIQITLDEEAGTLTIADDGIGMTSEEIVDNLGTIARSGTRAFLEQVGEGSEAPKLIGQFGLGFYASFMVADRVVVESRSAQPDTAAVRWTSAGEGTFEIDEGTRETRGTSITLHLREDSKEFGEVARIRSIVKKHSNFLAWPILVDEEQANSGKALWAEPPSQVSDEEANAFYKTVATDWRDPALRVHVAIDSPIQYHAMLFVPSAQPFDLFYPDAATGPRLYARRVLIEENAEHLLPKWLRFVRGVVDSEDIQLNVSREMVQKTPIVRKIRDALTKRVLKKLARFAKAPAPELPEPSEDEDENAMPPMLPAGYDEVWRAFGVLLKEGYYHDKAAFGELILPLLRFNALSHEDGTGLVSLAEYVASMPEDQDEIWYLTAESRESALVSPHLEAFRKKGWEVLILTDPVDEWFISSLESFEEKTVKSVSRGQLDIEDEEDGEDKADLTGFTPWIEEILEGAVSGVRESNRLTDSAAVLVDSEDGISANMERILRQANQEIQASGRVLELNAKHPLIRNLAALHEQGKADSVAPMARLLLDDALLMEGSVKDAPAIGRRLQDLLVRASQAELGGTPESEAHAE
jgi:molecular chaperone HtpG